MNEFTFKAIGTTWTIQVDNEDLSPSTQKEVREYIADFEQRFSRFLPNSEVNAFRDAKAGKYAVSTEFAKLLSRADQLRKLTDGVYDPAAGALLERAGYNASYTLEPTSDIQEFTLPRWSLQEGTLSLDGPTSFDLGGIGKGYCIDQVANVLKKLSIKYFLINAGGDIFGTTKADGSPWHLAIQYPGKPDLAAGTVNLSNQALAVSDSFRRRWGNWHHLVNPKQKQAVVEIIGAVALSQTAWDADCITSVLFLGPPNSYQLGANQLNAEYLVFKADGEALVSLGWKDELF